MNVASTLLARVFAALNMEEIEYCLLRGYNELVTPAVTQQVDMLLRPEHRAAFETVLGKHGFAPWPAWGHGPHRCYVGYDGETDCWLRLDVAETLRYGAPVRWLEVRLANRCLRRRRRRGPTWFPSPEDQLVTLLLHCVLDRHQFRDTHVARLRELWQEIATDRQAKERLFRTLAACLGRWEMLAVVQAFELRDLDDLLSRRGRWTRRLFWRSPFGALRCRSSTFLASRARRFLIFLRGHGSSTVLLAPDGRGRSALAAALKADPLLQASVIRMGRGDRAAPTSQPTSLWLGALAGRPRLGQPWRALLRALAATTRLIEDWSHYGRGRLQMLQGRIVVFERYFYDAYLSPDSSNLRRWFLLRACPEPDLILLLDPAGDVLHEAEGEHTPAVREAQRQSFLALEARLPQCRILDTTAGPDAVRREAIAHIWERHAARHGCVRDASSRSRRQQEPLHALAAAGEKAPVIS